MSWGWLYSFGVEFGVENILRGGIYYFHLELLLMISQRNIKRLSLIIGAIIVLLIADLQIVGGSFPRLVQFFLTAVSILVAGLLSSLVMRLIGPWDVASPQELEREDSAFIEGIGFLQATLLLFVTNYMEKDLLSLILSVNIVIITVVFYAFRAYAHIKNNSVWRWRSIWVLMIAFVVEAGIIISMLFGLFLDLFLLEWVQHTTIGLLPSIFLLNVYSDLKERFRIRYNLPHASVGPPGGRRLK